MGVLQEFYRNLVMLPTNAYMYPNLDVRSRLSHGSLSSITSRGNRFACILLNASQVIAIAKVLFFEVAISGVWRIGLKLTLVLSSGRNKQN